ncbi:GLPGLI family protein [Polaribacter cellanae]|uniref:GLPGLI family protein n=1 Tax=Polaribacter cellanae TaxID=2818493 RepID=A0A975H6L2_9FLAO|nr:GLPGLI family protein [Polaribacter cellanae]QTE22034.1 GLPGLI family protein [Polaribacter cellanae]
MKLILAILTMVVAFGLNAQNFQGKAVYKTHRKMKVNFGEDKKDENSEMNKQLQARLQKMFQKTYILRFNKTESIYKEDVALETPNPQIGGADIIMMGGGENDILYKNKKEKTYLRQTDIMGKSFLIKDKIEPIKWELSSETKNIGNYTCYKATNTKEVENKEMTMVDGELKENTKMVKVVTTAWYTPQIPISNGPDNYGGLPGLILEINDGELTIICSEIILNPKEDLEIKKPRKGKEVNQEEFNKIQEKKSKEIMEQLRNTRGKNNGMEIKIGG